MADKTSGIGFNLIDSEDLVEVDRDINYNFKRADTYLKPLLGYQLTDVPNIGSSDIHRDIGFKFYKWYSNSFWICNDPQASVYQDSNTNVSSWTTTFGAFEPGYGSMDLEENRTAVYVNDGWVTWRGRFGLNNGLNSMPNYTVVNFLTVNADLLPTEARYFVVGGGYTTGIPQVARIFVPPASSSDKRMEFIKYGGTPTSASERFLTLNIRYPLNDSVV